MMDTRQARFNVAVFSSAFFPPVHYFTRLTGAKEVVIESRCNYARQTYRNRCLIAGANGILNMAVPVRKIEGVKIQTKDVLISYATPWNYIHWKSIISAYNSSPYFTYYEKDISAIFSHKWEHLHEMNIKSIQTILECLNLEVSINFTDEFFPGETYTTDYREMIHPKKHYNIDPEFQPTHYHQVFSNKHGFIPNLSILDLLFNKGPESLLVLEESLKKK